MKRAAGQRLADGLVILLVILALAGGWALKVSAENQTVPYLLDGLHLNLSSGGASPSMENGVRSVRTSRFLRCHSLRVRNQRFTGGRYRFSQALLAASDALTLERARTFSSYRTLEVDETLLLGETGLLVSYVFVEEDPQRPQPTVAGGHAWARTVSLC